MVTKNSGTCNMWRPWPYLTKEQTFQSPSWKAGMPNKQEKKLRNTWLNIIKSAGARLQQDMTVLATAQMYYTRFYAIKSYQENDGLLLATAALFLACKTEMRPKSLGHVISCVWAEWINVWIKQQKKLDKSKVHSDQHWRQLASREYRIVSDKEWYQEVFEKACSAERALLYATGFQFNVYTAFHALVLITKVLERHADPEISKFFSQISMQGVWNFGIDIYTSTGLCLQYDPRTIAIACYECAGFCQKEVGLFPKVEGTVWWKYAARCASPPWTDDIGDPVGVLTILRDLRPLYGNANTADDDTPIGRFVKLKEAALLEATQPPLPAGPAGPAASAHLGLAHAVSGPSPGQTSSQTYDEDFTASSRTPYHDERSPPPLPPSNQDDLLSPSDAIPGAAKALAQGVGLKRSRDPGSLQDAQKRSKVAEDFVFAPSDEFSISPVRPPDGTNGNILETQESGEILLDENPGASKPQDPGVLRARLEKARTMLGQKGNAVSASHIANRQEKPPEPETDQPALDDFDVHFSP